MRRNHGGTRLAAILTIAIMLFGLSGVASAAEPNDGTMQTQGSGDAVLVEDPCHYATTRAGAWYNPETGKYIRWVNDNNGNKWSSDGKINTPVSPERGSRIVLNHPEVDRNYRQSTQKIKVVPLRGMRILLTSYYLGAPSERMTMAGAGSDGSDGGVTANGPIDQTLYFFGQDYAQRRIVTVYVCARPLDSDGVG